MCTVHGQACMCACMCVQFGMRACSVLVCICMLVCVSVLCLLCANLQMSVKPDRHMRLTLHMVGLKLRTQELHGDSSCLHYVGMWDLMNQQCQHRRIVFHHTHCGVCELENCQRCDSGHLFNTSSHELQFMQGITTQSMVLSN